MTIVCVNKALAKISAARELFSPSLAPRGECSQNLTLIYHWDLRTSIDIAELHPKEKIITIIIFHPNFALVDIAKKYDFFIRLCPTKANP